MSKKIINEYAIRSPDKRVYQGQMRKRYIGNLRRRRSVRKFPKAMKGRTFSAGIRGNQNSGNDGENNPSEYAEGRIAETSRDVISYSQEKAVAAGRRATSKRAEEKGRSRHGSGRNGENVRPGPPSKDSKSSSVSHARKKVEFAKHEGTFTPIGRTSPTVEAGRKATIGKVSSGASGHRTVGNSAVKGVNYASRSVSAALKRVFEVVKNRLSSLSVSLAGGAAVVVVIVMILVMTLTITSSFGQYNLEPSDNDLVNIALTQVGTTSGEEYWTWYGFDHEVGWCACFVSWCGDQTGLIQQGLMPRFAWVPTGVYWFQSRDQWYDNTITPEPGMIIFFDWFDETLDEEGEAIGQDGEADHVGIVEKVQDGYVYTVEGNTTEEGICAEKKYPIAYFEILGYGETIE